MRSSLAGVKNNNPLNFRRKVDGHQSRAMQKHSGQTRAYPFILKKGSFL
jgi:hypothetical protein